MSATLPTLTDSGLDDVYQWIGNIPLSRPVRNISKDLSDGVLVAEIISHYLPRYVAVNSFTHVNSVALKRYNWETLQKMVFKYLNFQLSDEQIRNLAECTHGTMEAFLLFIKDKIDLAVAEKRFRPSKRRTRSTASSRGSTLSLNQSDSEYEQESSATNLNKHIKGLKIASTPKSQIDLSNGQSKDEQIQKLLAQVQYLERIIDQKDEHIAALTKKIEQTNIHNGSKKKQDSGYHSGFKDEQSQVFMSQIHYLESVIQQKEDGIATLSKQVEKLMGMLYPEQDPGGTPDVPSPATHRQSLRNQNSFHK